MKRQSYLESSIFINFIHNIQKIYIYLTEVFKNANKDCNIRRFFKFIGTIITEFTGLVKNAFRESKSHKLTIFLKVSEVDVHLFIEESKVINKLTKALKLNKFIDFTNRTIKESTFFSKGNLYLKTLKDSPLTYVGIFFIFFSLISIILDVTIPNKAESLSLYINSVLLFIGILLLNCRCDIKKLNESSFFIKFLNRL